MRSFPLEGQALIGRPVSCQVTRPGRVPGAVRYSMVVRPFVERQVGRPVWLSGSWLPRLSYLILFN